jgi:hypothetical protein
MAPGRRARGGRPCTGHFFIFHSSGFRRFHLGATAGLAHCGQHVDSELCTMPNLTDLTSLIIVSPLTAPPGRRGAGVPHATPEVARSALAGFRSKKE